MQPPALSIGSILRVNKTKKGTEKIRSFSVHFIKNCLKSTAPFRTVWMRKTAIGEQFRVGVTHLFDIDCNFFTRSVCGSLHKLTDCLGNLTMLADDLAHIGSGYGKLQADTAFAFFSNGNNDVFGTVNNRSRNVGESALKICHLLTNYSVMPAFLSKLLTVSVG